MTTNCGLLHELWHAVEDGGEEYMFCLAGTKGDAARGMLPASAKLVWTVWAESYAEAMTRYYERQGWGVYRVDHPSAWEAYPAEWVQEQRQFLAGFSRGAATDGSPG